tara:strand:+ start:83340 stop:84539 length:1200 start_codon:yes stop_codon:yes gene_type:complete
MRTLIAALVTVSFTAAGCDKVEGLVEDGKSLVNGEEPTVADTPPIAEPAAPPTITTPEPVVPAGPTPQQIVEQFTSLRPDQITDGSLAQLASSPEAAATITEINMQGAQVSGKGLGYLAAMPNLETLNISGSRVASDSLTAIGKAQSLKSINLANSDTNDHVVSELSRIPHLQSLDLSGTRVTGGSATGLSSMRELTDLILTGTAADDQVVSGLVSLPLRKLELSKTNISNASLPMILKIQTLESLNVSFCGVTGDAFKGFGKSGIKELAVGETQFGIEGFMAIKGMSALENLNVYAAGLVEHKSANVFRTFPNLKVLNAGRNPLTDAGMNVFFKGHKTLEELHLQLNKGITDNGLAALIGVKTLRLLDVAGTSCGAAGAQALKAKLPECVIRTSNGQF